MNQDGDAISGEPVEDAFSGQFAISSPDLLVLSVNGPSSGVAGQSIEVTWLLTNQGNASVSRPISEVVLLSSDNVAGDDVRIGSFVLTNEIPPGDSLGRTQLVTIPPDGPAGTLWLVVETDANHDVAESNETNNTTVADTPLTIPLALRLQLGATSAVENTTFDGLVSRNGSVGTPLEVTLTSSDTTEVTVPSTVMIPTGQTEAAVTISAVADGISDGIQTATITATATGYSASSNQVAVLDADIPGLTLVISNTTLVEGQTSGASVTRSGESVSCACGHTGQFQPRPTQRARDRDHSGRRSFRPFLRPRRG